MNGWFDAKKELPLNRDVLIYCRYKHGTTYSIAVGRYNGAWWPDCYEVIAWHELPEPPEYNCAKERGIG